MLTDNHSKKPVTDWSTDFIMNAMDYKVSQSIDTFAVHQFSKGNLISQVKLRFSVLGAPRSRLNGPELM